MVRGRQGTSVYAWRAVKGAVLNVYGLTRLTAKTSQYLDECLVYNSHRPTAT
jgi:hypothetical protein